MIFSLQIIEQVFLTNQILEMNMPQISKTKSIVNFGNVGVEKTLQLYSLQIKKIQKRKN